VCSSAWSGLRTPAAQQRGARHRAPERAQAAGKDATGEIQRHRHAGRQRDGVECRDDGAGLDLARIRSGQWSAGCWPRRAASDAELANSSSARLQHRRQVTELAGRGVGLDVVRAEVNAMGGRIETASVPGQGTRFKLLLPLTTAVTQVVMLRCGSPGGRALDADRGRAPRAHGRGRARLRPGGTISLAMGEQMLPFFWLAALLQHSTRAWRHSVGRTQTVVVVRSAAQRVAVHVDEVLGNQEVVVKNVGPQLSRLPGLAGVTLLPSGAVALIYNPVALATLYGEAAQRARCAPAGARSRPRRPQELRAARRWCWWSTIR
jgi:chemosensory pili system protein ChpA (sensor histidine kinase/response regulator)